MLQQSTRLGKEYIIVKDDDAIERFSTNPLDPRPIKLSDLKQQTYSCYADMTLHTISTSLKRIEKETASTKEKLEICYKTLDAILILPMISILAHILINAPQDQTIKTLTQNTLLTTAVTATILALIFSRLIAKPNTIKMLCLDRKNKESLTDFINNKTKTLLLILVRHCKSKKFENKKTCTTKKAITTYIDVNLKESKKSSKNSQVLKNLHQAFCKLQKHQIKLLFDEIFFPNIAQNQSAEASKLEQETLQLTEKLHPGPDTQLDQEEYTLLFKALMICMVDTTLNQSINPQNISDIYHKLEHPYHQNQQVKWAHNTTELNSESSVDSAVGLHQPVTKTVGPSDNKHLLEAAPAIQSPALSTLASKTVAKKTQKVTASKQGKEQLKQDKKTGNTPPPEAPSSISIVDTDEGKVVLSNLQANCWKKLGVTNIIIPPKITKQLQEYELYNKTISIIKSTNTTIGKSSSKGQQCLKIYADRSRFFLAMKYLGIASSFRLLAQLEKNNPTIIFAHLIKK